MLKSPQESFEEFGAVRDARLMLEANDWTHSWAPALLRSRSDRWGCERRGCKYHRVVRSVSFLNFKCVDRLANTSSSRAFPLVPVVSSCTTVEFARDVARLEERCELVVRGQQAF